MKENFDLIRDMLIFIDDESQPGKLFVLNDFLKINPDKNEIVNSLQILKDNDYIIAEFTYADDECAEVIVMRLTPEGRKYLNAIRDPKTWEKINDKLLSMGASASFFIIKAVAEGITTAAIKEYTNPK